MSLPWITSMAFHVEEHTHRHFLDAAAKVASMGMWSSLHCIPMAINTGKVEDADAFEVDAADRRRGGDLTWCVCVCVFVFVFVPSSLTLILCL